MIESGEILLEPNDMYLLEMDSAYKPITNDQIQKKLELFYKKYRRLSFSKINGTNDVAFG